MAGTIAKRRERRWIEQHGLCHYCRQPMWTGANGRQAFAEAFRVSERFAAAFQCTAEHLKPRGEGGTDRAENIVAACRFCNVTRHRRARPLAPEAYALHVRRRLGKGHWLRLPGLAAGHAGRDQGSESRSCGA